MEVAPPPSPEHDDDDDIPPFFLCPISLQLMRDPVTLPTGITYDRNSIEEWLSSSSAAASAARTKRPTCPVTKQTLAMPLQLIPNVTLRRLIESWCSAHPHISVPAAAPDDPCALLREAHRHLPKLRDLVADSDHARRALNRAGAAALMLRILTAPSSPASSRAESLAVLNALRLSDDALRELVGGHSGVVEVLTREMAESGRQGRAHAVVLLHAVVRAGGGGGLGEEVFAEVGRVVRDDVSYRATKAALKILREALPAGRNRVRAAEAGVVEALVALLLDLPENRVVEMAMAALELLCGCAEGRAALAAHAAGIAVVAAVLNAVSDSSTERAVSVLWLVSRHASAQVVDEMAEVGAAAKLCYCLQAAGAGGRVGERAREVLRTHARRWRTSPCVPQPFLRLRR